MSKKQTVKGILVNEDVFDFKDLISRFLDSLHDFTKVVEGKGFDLKKDGYSDEYVRLCVFTDSALSQLDFFIDSYSIDFLDERYKERDLSYENS